ncbi:probable glycosyltransferase At5g03795 [Tripterygium wilfordii]|uniref:probable glycosyltransferase At5g03795 n=1 Tax=Tripterygium wilfordii TaxID=458696 RepID=UPI0018F86273|nr:probable glycosyltransferase At5g03795 [Tripterygium wilfordii]
MPSRVKFFLILSVAVAISAIFLYPYLLPRIANDQVNNPVQDSGIFEQVFQNPDVFLRNYALMEKDFKIFMYPKSDQVVPFYREPIPQGINIEVIFSHHLRFSERFHTYDDTKAHMFFIPLTWFQIRAMGSHANSENYVRHIIDKYPYWNRSKGFDHFLLTCCDVGAIFSERVPLNNSIKVSCSVRNDSRNKIHHKHHHITLPQIRHPHDPPSRGNDIHLRTIPAFWACHKHPVSVSDWDRYFKKFKASKYCICDGASYVTRICITDSIHFGCVPVILYEGYELPFGDILDWTKFSVIINKDNALRVKKILEAISDSKFSGLHNNILKVQRHFYVDEPAEGDNPYDLFHMIMYELWLRHHERFSDS